MKLTPRILLLGVALPLAGMFGSVMIAGRLFRASLLEDVDRRLLAQAAVESVSLFDGPEGKPHLHLPKSPLAAEVAAFAPDSTLIDPLGAIIVRADDGHEPDPIPRAFEAGHPKLQSPTPSTRTLTLGVQRPGAGVYTLHLEASLAPLEATMASFNRALLGTVATIILLLTALLYWQARRLANRVTSLIAFVPVIRTGAEPPVHPIEGADELAELGLVLSDAARFLFEQNLSHERFLANAAHQLRTPLAVLKTEIDLALRRPRDAAQLKEALEMARTETERLTVLARKLLDFESLRSQPIVLLPFDLKHLVAEVVERRQTTAHSKNLTLTHQSDALTVQGDAVLLSQALENLVDNALRFAPVNGRVTVTAGATATGCLIAVRDDGPGIPDPEREKIFEPFFRGSLPGSQTGLGLAFVADVARKHGGRAFLSPSEKGTTISLEFPRSS